MFVAKRILIITNETKFALDVKKALERNGKVTVSIFSSGKAGIDYARSHPQDVAVVDFRMKDMPGTDMVDHLRTLQHDIAIIAAPNHTAIHDLQERYNIQRIINIPMSIRKFVASLNTAKQDVIDKQPTNEKPPMLIEGLSVERSPQTMEFWLAENEDGETVLDSEPITEPDDLSPESSATFQRLAAEEPPMPTMSEGSTIRDLRQRLTNLDEIKRVLAIAAEEETEPVTSPIDTQSIPAALILEAALDESNPIYAFSLQEFMNRATDSNISPLPSWQREDGRYVTEPDFLPDELPFPELDEAIEYTGTVTIQTTPPRIPQRDQDPSEWVTDTLEPIQRSHPIEDEPIQHSEPIEASPLDDAEAAEHSAALGRPKPPLPPELPDLAVSTVSNAKLPYIDFDDDDSQIAQLATTLTQVALELTADATVLARKGKIVGYAGRLPMSDLEGLLDQLTVEWDSTTGSDKSRILFAEIPETGAEFMISTRGTAVGFTLSLIFSGTRPLHDIRRQSKRLADVLATLPTPEPTVAVKTVTQASEPIEIVEEVAIDRTPIAYLWLQRDADLVLNDVSQSQIINTLDTVLTQSNWKIGNIEAADYVYIYGEMPTSANPRQLLNDLMQKTAQSVNTDAQQLWDDSYLILQPGREIQTEEIQRFINFARR
ncbi:MAG: response regulator [Phototrophicaceae bacterium]